MPTDFLGTQRLRELSRRLLLAAAALFVFSLCGARPLRADDWLILDRPTSRDLNKLSFIDNLRGWVVGDSGTILMTSDGGESWATQISPVAFDIVDIKMINAQLGWALAQQFPYDPPFEYGTKVIRTTNGGSNWSVQASFNEIFLHAIDFTSSTAGCLGGDEGRLWWTSDGGVNWIDAVIDSPAFAHWPIRDVEFYTPTYGMASGGLYDVTGLVWRTTDGGANWTHERVAGEPVFGLHFFDSLNVIGVGGDLDFGAGMVQTSTAGDRWDYTYLGIWGQACAVSFRTPTDGWSPLGFAGTYMHSLNGGVTWAAQFTPDSSAMVDVVFTDSSTGYMVGAGGTILRYVGALTSVGEPGAGSSVAAAPALLLQNSPNPFHPRTQFGFRLSQTGFVSLKVYDPLGREVATLVDEALAPGTYTRTFDGSRLSSGVYYYRLAAGRHVETKKMLLIR